MFQRCIALVMALGAALAAAATASGAQQTSEARESRRASRVDSLVSEWDRVDSPGCALGVIRDGELIYRHGYGMANLEHNIPWTSGSVTQIRSLSKQFTAMAILLLARDEVLSLDDDVRVYVPELPIYDEERPVTIRDLMHHTSGLRDYTTLMLFRGLRDDTDHFSEDEALAMIVRQKRLNFRPGERFLYSNSGYFLMKVIVERASGLSLRQYADAHIFRPLGMTHTHFHDDLNEIVPNRAQGYTPRDEGGYRIFENPYVTVGPGGLFSSVEDLVLWDREFYEPVVGDRAVIEQMTTPGVLNNGESGDYAGGLSVETYRGLPTIDHAGGGAGYRTHMIRFPEQRFSVITLCNVTSIRAGMLSHPVADIYLADDFPEAGRAAASPTATGEAYADVPAAKLERLAGTYTRGEPDGNLFKVTFADGGLAVTIDGFGPLELAPLSETLFRVVGFPDPPATIAFEIEKGGKPTQLGMQIEGDPKTYEFPLKEPTPLTAEVARDFVGRYYSDEVEVFYNVAFKDGVLRIQLENQGGRILIDSLTQVDVDAFSDPDETVSIKFTRDQQSLVTGMTASSSRVKNLAFARVREEE